MRWWTDVRLKSLSSQVVKLPLDLILHSVTPTGTGNAWCLLPAHLLLSFSNVREFFLPSRVFAYDWMYAGSVFTRQMVGILNSKIELSEVWKAEKHLKYSHAECWQDLCELFLAKIKAIKRRLLRKKVRRKSNWRVMISSGFCRWPNQNTRALQVHVNL